MNRFTRLVSVLALFVYGAFASQGVSQTQTSNMWTSAGQMTQGRSGAAAVLLNDGRVLITGGTDNSGVPQATAEVYNPATGAFTASAAMNAPRANHAAIVLKTGDVLVTGGLTTGGGYSDSAEIYSVSSQQWTLLPSSIGTGLAYHAMAQLSDGNILIAGGTSTTKVVGSIVLFNLTAKTFNPIGTLGTPRTNAVAAATPDGRVLIAGGTDIHGTVLASTEIFVYTSTTMTGTIAAGPTMTSARLGATATGTYDGVAIIGGNNGQNDLGTAEIFSQWTNTLKVVNGGTPRSQHFAALLPNNGGILVMGGTGGTAVDILQPWGNKAAGAFITAPPSLVNQNGGFGSPASLGSLLAAGGTGDFATAAELYWFPTVSTDKSDYPPGTPVKMTGTGFQPLEIVNLHLHEWVDQTTEDDPDGTVTADALGNFSYEGYAPTPKDLGARYHLTAVGASSGYQAQTIFTDGTTYLNFTNAPLDQATNACGALTIGAGTNGGGYDAVTLTDSTTTGGFYTNSSCTGTAITSFTPSSANTNLWYKNSASGNPQLSACTQPIFGFCVGIFGGASASQTESIYGPPTQLVFAQQPGGGQPGTVWAQQPVLDVEDANYNTVAANSDPITLTLSTNPGGGTLVCASNTQNASSGIASFSGCTITGVTSSNSCYKITATDTSATNHFVAISSCFYIENKASAGTSTVIASTNPATNPVTVVDNGTAFATITVTLKDSSSNPLGNKAVTITPSGGGSTLSATSGVTNASGVVTITVTDSNPEAVTYSVTDTTDNLPIGSATVTFAAGAVSTTRSTVSANPTNNVPADGVTTSTITVTLQDSSGDAIAGETVTLAGTGSSVIVGSPATTNSNGVATFTVTDTHVENVTYTASYSGANGTGSLSTHTVTVGFVAIPTTLSLTVNPNAITQGTTPVLLTAGLSVTSSGAGVGPGASVKFYEGSGNCGNLGSSTLLATVGTDSTGSATYTYATNALAAGSYPIFACSAAVTLNNLPYAAATFSSNTSTTLTVGVASNLAWSPAPPASETYSVPNPTFTPGANSPSGSGHSPCAVTIGVSGNGCGINPRTNQVTITSGGGLPPGSLTCTVTASLAACSNRSGGVTTYYGPATISQQVALNTAQQATLNITGVNASEGDGVTFPVGTTGGSGTGAVTYSVTGACTVSGNQVTMNATGGGFTCTVTATKASDGNYALATASATATSNGTAIVQITNTSQTYTGSALPVTVTTFPGGLSYSVTYTCTSTSCAGSPNTPIEVGNYTVMAMVTTPGVVGSATATETISQSSPGLVLALQTGTTNPSPYGTMDYFVLTVSTSPCPTGTVQLTVDGTNVGASQAIECSTPIVFSTATIEPGTHNVVVQYSGDTNNAPSQSNPITPAFVVSADTTSVTLTSTTTPVYVGQTITFTATVGPTSLDPSANGPLGTVQFYDGTTPLGPPQALSSTSPYTATYVATLAEGSHSITAVYIPGSDAEFSGSSSAIEVAVVQYITPTINWTAPTSIVYGTPLSDAQLNAAAIDTVNNNSTVAGVFTYTPAANTVLAVGTTSLQVSFVPTDTATYGAGPYTASVPITITGATLLVTADNQTMPYGGPIPTLTYQITGFVAGDVPNQVTGSALCQTSASLITPVSGSPYTITCSLGSLVEPNYTFTFAPGTLTETTATPALSLICPSVTYDGNPHSCEGSAIGVDLSSQVTGVWTITPGSETAPGNYPESATFASGDTNYSNGGTVTGTLIISVATSSVSLICPSSVPYNGAAQTPCTATVTGAGGVTGSPTLAYSNNTNAGTASVTATYAGDANHTGSSNTVTFAISPAAVTAVATNYTWVYNGTQETLPTCTLAGNYTGSLTCSFSPTMVGADVNSGPVTPTVNGDQTNFQVTIVPGTWSITKAPSTVSLLCPTSVVYNGSAQQPCTVTVTGANGLDITNLAITYTNNINVGPANASATYAGDTDHAASATSSVNFAITTAGVVVQTGSYSGVYDTNSHALTACTVTGTGGNTYIGGLICTNIPLTEGPDVGGGTVPSSAANLSGDTLSNFAITYLTGNWSITKAGTSVTVNCPTSVVYNGAAQTPCSATVTLVGGVTQPVTPVAYTNNINVGTNTAGASASYAGTTDYGTSTGSATFSITTATVKAMAGSYSGPYTGAAPPIPACTITGVAFATGLTCTDNPTTAGPGVGGPVTVVPDVTGDTGNFTINLVNGSWTITPALETITLGNLSQFFTGSPATPVTESTSPTTGLPVTVLYGTTGNPTVATSATPPTAVGSYAVSATINNADYSGSTIPANPTLVISAATSNLTLILRSTDAEPSLYGSTVNFDLSLTGSPCPTGTVQWWLDGATDGTPVTLPATCTTPLTLQTDTLLPGSHQVYAVFTSGDGNYTSGTSNIVTHGVSADTSTVSLTGPSSANVDQSVTFTAYVVPTSTPGSGALLPTGTVQLYNGTTAIGSPVTITELGADLYVATLTVSFPAQGSYTISAQYVSTDGTEYPGSSTTTNVTVGITQIVPKITWATPASIVYGTLLSTTQLNAAATDPTTGDPVPGNFVYNPASGALVPAGLTNGLSVTFTPTNPTGPVYSTATATVNLVVTPAVPTLKLTCAAATYNGTAQQTCVGSETGVTGGVVPTGTWVYSPTNETNAGTYTITGTFTSTSGDYQSGGTATGTMTISPEAVTARAGNYTGVYTGNPVTIPACVLSVGTFLTNLNCTDSPASVGPGVSNGPVAPTVTAINGDTLSNYAITRVNGAYSITQATSTVTVTCPTSVIYNGLAQAPCTAVATGAGSLNQTLTVTYTANTNAGTATANATFAGDTNHTGSTGTKNFTISPAPVTATAGSYNATYDGNAHAPAPLCAVTGNYIGTLTCTNNPASVGPAVGSGAVTPTVTGGTLTNFAITSAPGTWSITKGTTVVTVTCPPSVSYNGAAQAPCTANVTGPNLNQTLTVAYTNNTNAGTATANASYAGDTNHNASSGSATFAINAAAVTATAGNLSGVYSGAAQTPSACAVTGPYKVGVTCSNNPPSVGPGVGNGPVTPVVSGGNANFAITLVNGAWSITQATSTVSVTCPASVTYNGAAQAPCTATVTGVGGLNQPVAVTYSNNTNAGTATANATYAGDTNHTGSSGSKTFTINPAAVTATAGGYTGVYDGNAHATAPLCAVTGSYTTGVSCANNPTSVGPAVGSGAVTPTVTGGSANFAITLVNGAWSITKAASVVTVTCPASVTYNGAAQAPCTAAATGPGLNQTLTVTYTNNTNAGTATANAAYAGDTNHAAGNGSKNFTINPAAVTATAGSYNATYDGNAHATAPLCAVTGTFTGGLTCTNNPASVGPAVGSGAVTPTVTGGTLTNFAITSVPGTWSITKATSAVTVTCPASVTYSGAAQTPCTATVTGPGLNQTLTVAYTNNTNAGTATASASFAGDANHAASSNTANFTINPAAVTATAGSLTGVYTGAAQSPSACTLTGTNTAGLTCADNPASVGPAVGSGAVAPVVSGGTTNFAITLVNGTWSIAKATSAVTVTCPVSVTYNGAAQTPCSATVTGAGGLNQSVAVTYTNNTNAGTATANASFAGDANHATSSNTANFTISPAAATATAGNLTAAYNGSTQTPSACAITGTYTVGLSCTDNPASVGPAVGSGAVTPVVSGGNSNFAVTLVNGAWSITQATTTVTVTCPVSVTYNGAAQTPCTAAVTGVGGLNQVLTVAYTNNTNAGTATASASYAGSTDYAAGSNTANFTINPATITATAGSLTGIYNGAAQSPSACALTGAFTGTLTCADNPASVGPAVGSGTVTPTVSGGTLTDFTINAVNGTWSIAKATSTVTVTCPVSATYNGAAQAPCSATATGPGGLNQTLTVTYTNNTNAGTATANASYAGTANYAAASNSATFTINPAAVTATAGSYTGVADGSAHAPSACAITGAYTVGLSCTDNPASVGPAVGTGAVTPVVSGGTANFTITMVNGSWNITQPSLITTTTTVSCPVGVAFNGVAQTPCTATVTGSGGLNQTLTVTYTNNTNAGTATASASYAGNTTYAPSNSSGTFTINAAAVTATAGSLTGVYTGAAQSPSACSLTGSYTTGLSCVDNPASVGPAAGSGTVAPVVSGGNSNFAITLANGAWSIGKETPTVTVSCPASATYNGAAQTPCTATATGPGGLNQTLTVTYTGNTNAGTASASASFAGDANHATASNSATFTINPAAVTATAGSYSAAADGSAHAPSACTVTGAYTVGLSCTDNPSSVGPAVGSGTVTPVVSGGTANFAITLVNGSWNVTQPSLITTTTTVSCPVGVAYNGVAQTPCTATVTGSGGLNQTLTVNYTSNVNSGTATASASYAGNTTYAPSNSSGSFSINPAAVTATAGNLTGGYTGSAQTPTACAVTGAYTSGLTCSDSPASVGPAVGSGAITPTVNGGSSNFAITLVNGAWSITQVTPAVTVSCPTSVVYNGAAQAACTATVTGAGGLNQTLTVTYTNNTNAGTATANASYAGTTNYAAASNSATFTINPAAVTATAGSYSAAADGSAHAPSACTLTGAYMVGLSCTDGPASVGPAVGSGTVTPVVSGGSANFNITMVNGNWNITQPSLTTTTTTVTCPASVVYNGAAQAACTATVTGAGGLNQTLTVTYTNNINAGTATASASYAGNTTYAPSNGSGSFLINPAAVTATAGSYSAVADGSAHAPSACAVTGSYTGGLSCTDNPASVGPAVGSGAVTPVVSGGSANFAITLVNGSWNITQPSLTTTTTTVSCPASVIFNGVAQVPCTATVTGAGGLNQTLAVTYTNNSNAGTATANASYAGNTTYAASNGSGSFLINAAPVTATAGSYSAAADGSAHSPSACTVTGAYTAGLSCTDNPASVGPAVGSGTVAPVVSGGSANFAITMVNGNWNITQPSLTTTTTTVTCPASVVYNGAAQAACTATATGAGGLNQTLAVTYTNNTNAGTATASASYAGNTTYAPSNGSGSFLINSAPVTATAGSYSAAADGSAHSPSACAVTGSYTVGLSCTDSPASVGPAVGSGTVTPVVSGGTPNFAITLVNGSWNITQPSLTTTTTTVSCPASSLYNGAAQALCTATVTGAGGLNQVLTVSYTNNTNAGTATANASYAGNTTYAASNGTANFTISPAAVTATAGNYNGAADGSAHSPSACAVTGSYTVGLSCTDSPASVGPAVGSGTVTPVVSGGSANFVITPVNGSWSITSAALTPTTTAVSCPASSVYNGAAQALCTATVTGAGGLNQVMTVSYTNNTNAGTATANASYAGNTTYAASNGTANFTISPAAVTATAGSYNGAADGSAHSPSACAVTGSYTVGLSCTDSPASVGPAVGSGTVTPTVSGGTPNFAITMVNGSWSITPAALTPTTTAVSCPASSIYNGAAQALCTATVTGSGGLNQVLTVSYTNNTNAGTATANASYAGNTTYAASNGTANFTINPAPVTATAGSYSAVADGSAHAPSACAVTGSYTGGLSCTDNPASVGPAVGSGAVTPVVSGGSANFAITLVNGSWNITQPSLTTTTTTVSCPASVIFNGVAQVPCTATVTGAGGLNQTLAVTYTNNSNAGTATANASYAGNTTYAASNGTANFTINPTPVTATAGNYSGAADGSAHSPSACAVTGSYTVGLSCTDSPASVGPAAGSGPVTPVVSGGSPNFAITPVNGSWSITSATTTPTTTTVSCPASVVYSGAALTPCTATVTGAGGLNQTLTVAYTNNTNPGTATANASYAGTTTYAPSSGTAGFTITQAVATVTLSNLAQSYTGSPLPVTVTTTPPGLGLTVLYSSGTYPSSTTAPTNPGSYTVTATVVSTDYTGSATGTLVISTATSGLALQLRSGTPEPSPYGMMVYFDLGMGSAPCPTGTVQFYVDGSPSGSAVTLNGSSCSSPLTFQTATLTPGSHGVYAAFSGDTLHSAGNSNTVTHAVMADTTAVTLATSATSVNAGQPVTFTATVTPTSLDPSAQGPAGTVQFFDGTTSLGTITLSSTSPYTAALTTSSLAAGPHSISATYTSSDGEFTGSSSSIAVAVTVTTGKIAPTINWSNPASIVYGTPLSATQLNATATDPTTKNIVAGAFAYTPVTGTVLPVGTVNLEVSFTPSDTTTYSTQTATVTLTVSAVTPTLTLSCPGGTYNGTAFSCTGTATGVDGVTAVGGTWSYTPASETAAGSYPVTGTFTSTDGNYQGGTATGTLKINPAAVTATAGSYSAAADGSAHSPSACAVTGSYTVGLSCTDSPASVGPAVGSGTVTPVVSGGTPNFAITLVNGSWSIASASTTPTTTTVSCPASALYNGAALTPCTATVTGAGGLNQTMTVSYTNNTNAGTATANASYAGNTTYAASNGTATFTIGQASQAITFTQPISPVIYGVPAITLSATGSASGMPVVFSIDASSTGSGTISGSTLTVTGVGNLIIDANQAGNSNYLAATQVTRAIVVNVAALAVAANNASRVYGTNNPAFTGSVTGAVRGDTYTESYSTIATISSNVGNYPIVPSVTGADLADYTVGVQDGTLTITQAGTATSISASSSSVTPGQSVTLTAQVAPATTGTPTGSVTFYDGTSLLGTVPLTAGTATLSTSSLTAGSSNVLSAVYSGDTNFTTSTSSTSAVSVAQLDFSLAVSGSASQMVNSGSVATYHMIVNPLYGTYPGQVSFAASGLPSGASIAFSPSTIAANGGQQTVTLTIQTAAFAKEVPPSIGRKLAPFTALALFLIPLLGAGRLRKQGRRLSRLACLLLLIVCSLAGAMMTGCGGAAFHQIEQNYTIMVTSTSGNVQHSAPITLGVQ